MTTAIAMDIARPPAAAARLRSGRFRASSRRASRFATPRASSGAESSSDVPPDAPLRVVIVGGGIGLAACVALRRVGGVGVYERHRALERGHGHRALAEQAQALPPGRGARWRRAARHLQHALGVVDETFEQRELLLLSKLRDAAIAGAGYK